MSDANKITQLDPIIVRPEGGIGDSLFIRLMEQFNPESLSKMAKGAATQVKKDVTKKLIGDYKKPGTKDFYKKIATEGTKLAASDKPLTVVKKKIKNLSELTTPDYLKEVAGETVLKQGESALNKKLKGTGLKIDLPTNITDVDKISEGDYSDFTKGGFKYNLGKGWKLEGSAKLDKKGQAGWKVGVKYKKDFDTPISKMVVDAFNNTIGKVKGKYQDYKQVKEDKAFKKEQKFKADMFYNSAKEVIADEMGLNTHLPTDKEIDETASKTRLTPVGPEVSKEADAFLKKKSYGMGKDLLLEDTMERLGLNRIYQALLNSVEEGEEIDFEFQDYLDLVTPIRPSEEI